MGKQRKGERDRHENESKRKLSLVRESLRKSVMDSKGGEKRE
jgi:hypothetical protein